MPLFRTRRTTAKPAPDATSDEIDGDDEVSGDVAVSIRDLRKSFVTLDTTVVAADGITLQIPAGSVTALTGPFGSGKQRCCT